MSNYIFGYANASAEDLSKQIALLEKYECNKILVEEKTDGPPTHSKLTFLQEELLRSGDIVIVESSTNLNLNAQGIASLLKYCEENNVSIVFHAQDLDTRTPDGQMIAKIFQTYAQFEREILNLIEYSHEYNVSIKKSNEEVHLSKLLSEVGNKVLHTYGEFEGSIKREQSRNRIKNKIIENHPSGSPKVNINNLSHAIDLYHSEPEYTVDEIVKMTGISRSTLYKYVQMTT